MLGLDFPKHPLWLVMLLGCGLLTCAPGRGASLSNTVVRFQISTGGADRGHVDVELFDQEKPETVRNFLLYVRNGSYDQVLLHRLLPGFVLQGGRFTNPAPSSSSFFTQTNEVRNLGVIPNEFGTGARLSNTLGTLTMARAGSDSNSASVEWFFNLGDNRASFDTQNGGFTVFGRVLPDTNQMAGLNLLATFNTRSSGHGIVNMADFFGPSWAAFANLPVDYSGFTVPQLRQLFTVKISELNGPSAPDTNAPVVAVAVPDDEAVVTNPSLTVIGTAADDEGVARVIYFLGDATPQVATGTTNWSAALTLAPGTNLVRVRSVDQSGNLSAVVERRIIYSLPPNTLVRFQIFTGEGVVGTVDVELFDREKPETVRNFLRYVRNRSFNEVLLHRLVPGFVLQGGGFTNVEAPESTNLFSQFGEINNLGPIANEFGVGARLSNTMGTLAMGKLPNDPNSASSQWFFNLANNASTLDVQNGGFTIFGRVLPDTNAMAGTNLLLSFNARSAGNGIINLSNFYGANWSSFTDVPVTSNGFAAPQSRQLYYVRVSELNGPSEPDTNAPVVAITSLPPDAVVTNASVTLFGTAGDDQGVARVIYSLGGSSLRVATGTTNWSAALLLTPGTNIVRVQSVDAFGNLSAVAEGRINYIVPPNTLVRFHITTGEGVVGDLDVELFDREKPETVRNFLRYVRNGSYRRVLLNRLVAGSVLQGGSFTNVDAADSTNLFSQFGGIKNLGPIPNEFAIGARLSNTVGTLAMARPGNDPDSASTEWFFNLGSHAASFDALNGGFTVFGRVLPATNVLEGTNLFSTFNSRSAGNGIINMASF